MHHYIRDGQRPASIYANFAMHESTTTRCTGIFDDVIGGVEMLYHVVIRHILGVKFDVPSNGVTIVTVASLIILINSSKQQINLPTVSIVQRKHVLQTNISVEFCLSRVSGAVIFVARSHSAHGANAA